MQPIVDIKSDTIIGDLRHINIYILPQRPVNRMELFADKKVVFKDFNINGVDVYKKNEDANAFENRWRNRLFSFYVSDNDSLNITLVFLKNKRQNLHYTKPLLICWTIHKFTVPKRQEDMIPKPFVLNDAVMVRKTIIVN